MNNKVDCSSRERKMMKKNSNNTYSKYRTSNNIKEKKELEKWLKGNNSKRGGKSRHYI
jgi:hypothetical protein